ncbi:MAG: hypothetical protein BWY76_02605 [bacterium ADurb.Bin429]|nr:MAG: hypothetical protein BWY76_02605 [bacterium ADurb.Bin429]
MADHHRAAGEGLDGFFQRAQGIHVQVVGGLVEEDDIRPLREHLRQVNAVALAAGEIAHLLLLVGALEIKAGDVGAGIERPPADGDGLLPAADLFPYGVVAVQRLATLVHVGELYRLSDGDDARIRLHRAGDEF